MNVDFHYEVVAKAPVDGPAVPGQVHTVSWAEPYT